VNGSTVISVTLALALLTLPLGLTGPEITEQAAREQAISVVRAALRSETSSRSDQFLSIHRDEDLEESLATVTGGWRSGPVFIYKISPTGVEVKENSVSNHVIVDGDSMFIVAITLADGSDYRIHGFGLQESPAEFERLMLALKVQVTNPDQADSVADFYREINPGNHEALAPIASLLAFKQAAERQCVRSSSFDADELAFASWWEHARHLYSESFFRHTVKPETQGFQVEWIVLSASAKNNCGGAPLLARLFIGSDGHVGKLTFSSLQKSDTSAMR
jgi:hypothetical protein